MKSKIEIRVFAVEQAVKTMGAGTPTKDVVGKAAEIEKYITDGIVLPDVATSDLAGVGAALSSLIAGNAGVADVQPVIAEAIK